MKLGIRPSTLRGRVEIPGSKSHTIRAVAFASIAKGESRIYKPLQSEDTKAAVNVYRGLGAEIDDSSDPWLVKGFNGNPATGPETLNVLNSGTTLRIAMGTAALLKSGNVTLTGDEQIRRRPVGQLAGALGDLGARIEVLGNNGCPPVVIGGRLHGGYTLFEAPTSQYVTSLLINTPAVENDTFIRLSLLHEIPYVEMTLDWLDRLGAKVYASPDRLEYHVIGGNLYRGFERTIPADFSSATFFLAAGALPDNEVSVYPLDMTDRQGDKAVANYLSEMGAEVERDDSSMTLRVRSRTLKAAELDLNATPDALPMMAALACYADGETRLVNVAHARLKETDRIQVMAEELGKMGGRVKEREDGLEITGGSLKGAVVDSRGDHRVAMALAVAATAAEGETVIENAGAVSVTFPGFPEKLKAIGGEVEIIEE